jgi:DNA invertase Pin-like site-specific DNA recombinase
MLNVVPGIVTTRTFPATSTATFGRLSKSSSLIAESSAQDALYFDSLWHVLEKLGGCDKVFKEKRSGVDAGRPELKRCLEYLREGDTLLVSKLDRLARSTSDLYRIVSELADKGVSFKVVDDPSIDTSSRTGKLIMGILALIAEFENDIRRERQMDGIAKAQERGVRFGRKPRLMPDIIERIHALREAGTTVPEIMRQTKLSKASIYRALGR